MSWSIDPNKAGSLNDAPNFALPAGTAVYRIDEAKLVPDKKDPTGRTLQLAVTFSAKTGEKYTQYFRTDDQNVVTAEIAKKAVVALFYATGYRGTIKPEVLSKLKGKFVELVVTARQGKGDNSGKVFTNIDRINAVTDDTPAAAAPEPAPEPEPEPEPESEPAPAPRKAPWG